MIGRAAADDIQTAHILDCFLVQCQLRQVDFTVLQARRDRVAHGRRLFIDLLHHEMLIAALFGSLGIPFDGCGLAGDGLLVDVEEFDGVRGQACDLEIVNVVDRAGVLEQCRHIGGDDGTVLTLANDERAVLAHGIDDTGLIGKKHAQRIGAAYMQHHAGDGIQRVACRFAGVVVVQQLCHDLGVGLRDKGKAFVEQTILDLLIVFNDAVVHHGNLLVTGIMRVRVDHRRLPVGGPTGVADAAAAVYGIAAVRHLA